MSSSMRAPPKAPSPSRTSVNSWAFLALSAAGTTARQNYLTDGCVTVDSRRI